MVILNFDTEICVLLQMQTSGVHPGQVAYKNISRYFQHTHQDVPNIFIGSLKVAEANADPDEPLAAPHVAGCDGGFPHCQRLAAVQQHLYGPLQVHLQQLSQGVVVLVLREVETLLTY